MKKDPFMELMLENDEEKIDQYLHLNGKKKKPTNPIYQKELIEVKRRTKE